MKRKQTELNNARTTLDRLCGELLGADTVKQLNKAFKMTADALYRRAKQRAEAEMQLADQYRTDEPAHR